MPANQARGQRKGPPGIKPEQNLNTPDTKKPMPKSVSGKVKSASGGKAKRKKGEP